jgi:ATP/ADP translocase
MPIIIILAILATVLSTGFTLRTAYITADPKRRKAELDKLKKRDKNLHEQVSRMYTWRYVRAIAMISVGFILYTAGKFVERVQGEGAPLELGLGSAALIIGLTGTFLSWRISKPARR